MGTTANAVNASSIIKLFGWWCAQNFRAEIGFNIFRIVVFVVPVVGLQCCFFMTTTGDRTD